MELNTHHASYLTRLLLCCVILFYVTNRSSTGIMGDFGLELLSNDPVGFIVQSLLQTTHDGCEVSDNALRKLGDQNEGSLLDALVQNIKLLISLKTNTNLKSFESIRSSLSTHCESLRLFFVDVVYKRILIEANRRTSHTSEFEESGDETQVLMYLTTIYVNALIQFEQSVLSASNSPSSVYNNEHLAILQSILFISLGVCTNVSESYANMMKNNTQEEMLLLRQSAQVNTKISTTKPVSAKISMIQEVNTSAEANGTENHNSHELAFHQLSQELLVPASYRANYTSTAIITSMQADATSTTSAFSNIFTTAIVDLKTLCGSISTSRASRNSKLNTKSVVPVDSAVREDQTAVLTQSIINIARCWNASENSVYSDKLAAHAILCLLNPDSYTMVVNKTTSGDGNHTTPSTTTKSVITLTSAAYTALVPIAMRLLDRYEPSLHTLGLLLLYKASDATPPGLLASFLDWVLPHLFTYLEIVSEDWSRLVVTRLIHSLLCCDIHSSVALKHAHLYIESSIRQLQLKPTASFAWPYLLAMNTMYTFMPIGVISMHTSILVDCYLQLLNVWHLPLQNVALESVSKLVHRLNGSGLEQLVPRIATELVRMNLFYESTQSDISNASSADRATIIHNSVLLGKQLRQVNSVLWDNFVQSVLESVVETTSKDITGGNDGGNSKNSRTKGADEHVVTVLRRFQHGVTVLLSF